MHFIHPCHNVHCAMCSCAPVVCTDELIELYYQVTVVSCVMPSVVDHIQATLVGQNAKFLLQCGPIANVLTGDVCMRIHTLPLGF